MKKFNVIIAILISSALAVLVSCKEDDSGSGTDSGETEAAADLTSTTWSPADAGSVTLDNTSVADWENFTLKFNGDESGGTFTTSNVPEGYENVWPSQGTWEFKSSNGTVDVKTIVRTSDGIQMGAVIGEGSLDLSFDYSVENGRVKSITGAWTFNLQ